MKLFHIETNQKNDKKEIDKLKRSISTRKFQ